MPKSNFTNPTASFWRLAHKIEGKALFAHQEQELADEMGKKIIWHNLTFLGRDRIGLTQPQNRTKRV
jgi:hypothetical protein